jgi:WD40 repeat protein
VFALLISATAVGVAADRWVRDVESRARLKTEEAERNAAVEKAAIADMTATLTATLMSVRERRDARSAEWASTNLADLRRIAALPVATGAAEVLRNEAAAALAGIDLGTPRVVAPNFKAYALAFSPNGRALALGSWFAVPERSRECLVKVIDPATGHELRQLTYPADPGWELRYGKFHIDGCRSIAYSPDGRWLVVGTRSGWLVRWDLHKDNPQSIRWRHAPETTGGKETAKTEHVDRIAFDDLGRLLSCNDGRQVAVWDTTGEWGELSRATHEFGFHLARPSGPALSTAHPQLLQWGINIQAVAIEGTLSAESSRGGGNRLVLVDRTTARQLIELTQPEHPTAEDAAITDAVFSPDGQILVTSAEGDYHLKLWDTISGRLLAARTLSGGRLCTSFSPDGRTLAVTVEDGVLL